MTEASADPRLETIHITCDDAYSRRSSTGRRRAAKGLAWTFRFSLREGGPVHSCSAGMATWTVDPPGRTTGAWRPGAEVKIVEWIANTGEERKAECQLTLPSTESAAQLKPKSIEFKFCPSNAWLTIVGLIQSHSCITVA